MNINNKEIIEILKTYNNIKTNFIIGEYIKENFEFERSKSQIKIDNIFSIGKVYNCNVFIDPDMLINQTNIIDIKSNLLILNILI